MIFYYRPVYADIVYYIDVKITNKMQMEWKIQKIHVQHKQITRSCVELVNVWDFEIQTCK